MRANIVSAHENLSDPTAEHRATVVRIHPETGRRSFLIGGAADPAAEYFMANYERLASHWPKLRSKILLDGVGHSAAEEQPDEVNRRLLAFLAGIQPRSLAKAGLRQRRRKAFSNCPRVPGRPG